MEKSAAKAIAEATGIDARVGRMIRQTSSGWRIARRMATVAVLSALVLAAGADLAFAANFELAQVSVAGTAGPLLYAAIFASALLCLVAGFLNNGRTEKVRARRRK
jgi:hypothetical protein